MSVATYISNLQKEKNISYMQLAKEIGITYQNMMDLKNGRIALFSDKVLTKLSVYESRTKLDILYDSINDDQYEKSSKCALKYLCQCIIDGYSITFKPNYPNPFKIGRIYFEGLISKKRIVNNYAVVDSWEKIKKEHLEQYRNIEYSRDAYIDLFINENMYINSVINYAISKIDLVRDERLRTYILIVGKNVSYDESIIMQYIPQRTKIKILVLRETENGFIIIKNWKTLWSNMIASVENRIFV